MKIQSNVRFLRSAMLQWMEEQQFKPGNRGRGGRISVHARDAQLMVSCYVTLWSWRMLSGSGMLARQILRLFYGSVFGSEQGIVQTIWTG